jgi:phospholipid/cholesterol/gamma-HCH transport system permease protein
MSFFGTIGRQTRAWLKTAPYVTGLLYAVLRLAFRVSIWNRPLLRVLTRQIYYTAIQGIPFIVIIALLMGITVVIQAQILSSMAGQASLTGAVLVLVLMRELAPLLVNFVMIGRSGAAIAAEMASMTVNGDVKVLDAQGLDPMIYLVIPRVLGAGISVFCLAVVFVLVAFSAGYVCGAMLGLSPSPGIFLEGVLAAIGKTDAPSFLAKTLLPGMATAAISCSEGLSIRGSLTEIPQATTRAVVRSTFALVMISALITAVTYG